MNFPRVIEDLVWDFEKQGVWAVAVTDIYIVLENPSPQAEGIAYDILDSYLAKGRISNYYFDDPTDVGLDAFERGDIGIEVEY